MILKLKSKSRPANSSPKMIRQPMRQLARSLFLFPPIFFFHFQSLILNYFIGMLVHSHTTSQDLSELPKF